MSGRRLDCRGQARGRMGRPKQKAVGQLAKMLGVFRWEQFQNTTQIGPLPGAARQTERQAA